VRIRITNDQLLYSVGGTRGGRGGGTTNGRGGAANIANMHYRQQLSPDSEFKKNYNDALNAMINSPLVAPTSEQQLPPASSVERVVHIGGEDDDEDLANIDVSNVVGDEHALVNDEYKTQTKVCIQCTRARASLQQISTPRLCDNGSCARTLGLRVAQSIRPVQRHQQQPNARGRGGTGRYVVVGGPQYQS
jgi:hypothetical protein